MKILSILFWEKFAWLRKIVVRMAILDLAVGVALQAVKGGPLSTVNIVWCSPHSWMIAEDRLENWKCDEEQIFGNSFTMNVVLTAQPSAITENENWIKELEIRAT